MTKVLHGIVHGKIIEVTEDLSMLDGQAVELIVTASPASVPCAEEARAQITEKTSGTTTRMAAWFQANGRGNVGGFVDGRR